MRHENLMILLRQKPWVICGSIGCLILTLLVSANIAGNAQSPPDDKFQPFVQKDYDPGGEFHVSQKEFHNGSTLIRIIQAKKISKNYNYHNSSIFI